MKTVSKILTGLLLAAVLAVVEAAEVKSLKVLTIGNSFSNSAVGDLSRIVRSDPAYKLLLKRAALGSCSLERHWKEHLKAEKNPAHKVYKNGRKKYSLKELLQDQKWDIVTLQQVSSQSWRVQTFEPYAENLIALIRKYAPTAEIVLQQTWSYNASKEELKVWKLTQKEMYERIRDSYIQLANRYNLRVIPAGLAVQIHREKLGKKLIPMDATGKYEKPKAPVTTDLVGHASWRKDLKTGKEILRRDMLHLSRDGRYMQGCLWFGFLYGKDPATIRYVPKDVKKDFAEHLRKCASEALAQYKQVKK